MTKAKHSVTWIDVTIKRLVKQRHKLYLRARNTKDPDIKIHYKRFRAHVHKVLRDAFWKYVSSIFLRLRTTSQIPTLLSLKRFKSFGHFFVVLVQQSIFSLSPPLSLYCPCTCYGFKKNYFWPCCCKSITVCFCSGI